MNIEVMAWASFAAGLATFATMTIHWIPTAFKFLLWFCGLSFMGFAMIYLVSVYDPPRAKSTIEFAYWLMLASRVAVPLLAVYIYVKWGSSSLRLMAVVAFMTSACGNSASTTNWSRSAAIAPRSPVLIPGEHAAAAVAASLPCHAPRLLATPWK